MSFETAQSALSSDGAEARAKNDASHPPSISLRDSWQTIWHRRRFIAVIEIALLLVCALYCLVAPNLYEAKARVELRTQPASSLSFDPQGDAFNSASVLSAPLSLETLAGVLRSDQLAWRVIVDLKLYQHPGFRGSFPGRFPNFNVEQPSPTAQAWLLDRFAARLHVQSTPHTFLVEVRFRCRDAALSAAVVNTLIRAYQEQEAESQIQATAQASGWLNAQLAGLKVRVDRDQHRLTDFEAQHGIVTTPEIQANGSQGETEHAAAILEIDELSRQLVTATTDRILSEAEYRAASQGDPEMVIASDPHLQADTSSFATALLLQLHARRSDLEQEQAQLSAEHGESFPRVVEIGRQLTDLDHQKQTEDAKLVQRFRSNWQTAVDREQLVRNSLDQATSEGLKVNQAAMEYAVMREEANASHDLYLRVLVKSQEAGLAAGVHSSDISIVDAAREPVRPVAPNPLLYLGITFFVGLWVAIAAAFLRDSLARSTRLVTILITLLGCGAILHAQVPSPNTSGLPGGVINVPQSQQTRTLPNPKEAPTVWNNPQSTGAPQIAAIQSSQPMPAPIAPGDSLDISEYHTPEF
ncbi:MAG: GNVR domain-containing protein, partial [Terracidiphilus sp.]